MDFRLRLLEAHTEEEFKRLLWEHTKELAEEQRQLVRKRSIAGMSVFDVEDDGVIILVDYAGIFVEFVHRKIVKVSNECLISILASHQCSSCTYSAFHSAPLLGCYWPCRDQSNPYASHCFDWRQ
jgi:hypothetical protein